MDDHSPVKRPRPAFGGWGSVRWVKRATIGVLLAACGLLVQENVKVAKETWDAFRPPSSITYQVSERRAKAEAPTDVEELGHIVHDLESSEHLAVALAAIGPSADFTPLECVDGHGGHLRIQQSKRDGNFAIVVKLGVEPGTVLQCQGQEWHVIPGSQGFSFATLR